MTSYEKLPLESALEETPQISSLVNIYSDDAKALGKYVEGLHNIASQLVSAHNKLTTAYQELSKHLRNYSPQILGSDSHGILTGNLKKFSEVVSEMSSWQHIVASQVADGVVYPLSKFIDSDLHELNNLALLYQSSSNEVGRAVGRYSRCRRRDPPIEKHEAKEELFKANKNYHCVALQYYSKLNQLQFSRQMSILQPILGLITAFRGHHHLGCDTLSSKINDEFMSSVGILLKKLSEEYGRDQLETDEIAGSILAQSQLLYYPEPPGDLAQMPPDTTLSSKEGYLNVHRKYMGVMSTWERQFVFIEGGNIMGIAKGEIAGCLLLELESGTLAHAADTDDRSDVFTVVTARKSLTLQAINDRERDEWMITIERHAHEGGYVRSEKIAPPTTSSSIFSEVGQYLADKLQSVSIGMTPTPAAFSFGNEIVTVNPPVKSAIPDDVPIIFDILPSIDEEGRSSVNMALSPEEDENSSGSFDVRFLGCMKVNVDTVESFMVGQTVVFEVMRRILEARAVHNMFNASAFKLSVVPSYVSIMDAGGTNIVLKHLLKDVAFWAAHSDNVRLLGYIVRNENQLKQEAAFSCYIFESDVEAKSVCVAFGQAARKAYDQMLDRATLKQRRRGETELLLANIANLPDKNETPEINDGFLILNDQLLNPVYSHYAPMQVSSERSNKEEEKKPKEGGPESDA